MRGSRRLLIPGVALVAAVGLVVGGPPIGAGGARADALFEEPGSHEFVVPEDVCEITVEAFGAEGGSEDEEDATGGLGGSATATIPVTPGEELEVNVGEAGEHGDDGGGGGFNGGGDGGGSVIGDPGGGGGGASDVRAAPFGLGDRLVIAGGGGGGGADDPEGGGGGGLSGEDGEDGDGTPGGGGGTQTAEGQGGENASTPAASGQDGSLGQGGDGGGSGILNDSGGGGGGGLHGGGGGAGDDETTDDGGGGGGGSGWGPPGTVFQTGVNEGSGFVGLTYTVGQSCAAAEPVVQAPTFTG